MTSTHARAAQSQSSTSQRASTVQRSAASGLRTQARSMDFAQGEAMYAPVQKRAVQREAKASEALATDVGEVASIPEFTSAFGGSLQASLPNVGNNIGVSAKCAIAAPPFIGKLGFEGEASRTTAGYETKGKLIVDFGVGMIATGFEASATIQASLEFAGKGDSIDECMALALVPVYDYLKVFGVNMVVDSAARLLTGSDVADLLFGATFIADLLKGMDAQGSGDETDEVKVSSAIGITAGVSAEPTKSLSAGVNGNLGYKYEETITKDANGARDTAGEHKLEGGAAVKIGPVTGGVKFSKGDTLSTDLEIECELGGLGSVLATYATTLWDSIAGALGVAANTSGDRAQYMAIINGQLRTAAVSGLNGWFATFAATPAGELVGAVSAHTIKGAFTFADGKMTQAKLTSEAKQGLKKSVGAGGGISIAGDIKEGQVLLDRTF